MAKPKLHKSPVSSSNLDIYTAPQFEPLLVPSQYKGAFGGRGSGKSWFFAELAIEYCLRKRGMRIVCVREIQRSLKESVKLNIEDRIQALGLGRKFRVLNDRIVTPGDGVIMFSGMRDHTAESIKSLEGFDVAYVEEAQMLTKLSLELLLPTIRKHGSEIWFSWNPRHASDPVDQFLRGLILPPDTVVVRTNWDGNPFFTKELEVKRVFDKKQNPARYAHIWEGEYAPQAVGAIWNMADIHAQRRARDQVPHFKRVIVSIDPSGSAEQGANETGIIVCALGEDNRGYVLDDVSLVGGPAEWAQRAIAAHDLYEADAVVAEVNFGGDMVKNTVHAMRPALRVIEVRASRRRGPSGLPKGAVARSYAKSVRAEPIAALYSLGRVSHVGAFPKLEAQMCLITAAGYEGEGSPDRVDAMVWGFTELFPKMVRRTQPKDTVAPIRADSLYNPHRRHQRR